MRGHRTVLTRVDAPAVCVFSIAEQRPHNNEKRPKREQAEYDPRVPEHLVLRLPQRQRSTTSVTTA
jgi:hypothetical protein